MDTVLIPSPAILDTISLPTIPFLKENILDVLKTEYDTHTTQTDTLQSHLHTLETRHPNLETALSAAMSKHSSAVEVTRQHQQFVGIARKFDTRLSHLPNSGLDKEVVLGIWRQGYRYIVQVRREIFELKDMIAQYQRVFRYV